MMIFSIATEKDIPAIQDVANETFPVTYAQILTPAQNDYMMEMMYSTDSLRRQFAEGHIYIIAWSEEQNHTRAVGYVSVSKERDGVCHLQKIYVRPGFQKLGLGKTLWEMALQKGIEICGHPMIMELNVNRNNKAVSFYERMGMHKDRSGDFDIGNGFYMNDYIMQIRVE